MRTFKNPKDFKSHLDFLDFDEPKVQELTEAILDLMAKRPSEQIPFTKLLKGLKKYKITQEQLKGLIETIGLSIKIQNGISYVMM